MVESSDETTEDIDHTEPLREARSTFALRWFGRDGAPYTRLDKNRLVLGRGGSSDAVLEASGVSREHAVLNRQGPVYAVSDNGSKNGTYVNGERIQHAALALNDVLRLGDLIGVLLRIPISRAEDANDVTVLGEAVFGPGLRSVLEVAQKSAPTTLPVVLLGETGVGKESLSRAFHLLSGRSGPFHAVNCAALPASLAEAELFGHRKGAFTGAEQTSIGHFRAADGGTLLLDELADLALPVQAKLLRALQDGEITPLGETRPIPVDVRLIAACQKPLGELVREGRLREDLMMRLSGITISIPPLRKRRADVGILFEHFLARFGSGTRVTEPRALERLLLHEWPGNVRELALVTRNVLALHSAEPVLRRGMLPDSVSSTHDSVAPPRVDATSAASRNEHDLGTLTRELAANGGNIAGAATAAGISRQRAYRLMAGRSVEELLKGAPPKSSDPTPNDD
jgi:DNA-binding NtrC family response regulator